MKCFLLFLALLCAPITVYAEDLTAVFSTDSVFVTNLLSLQNEITSSHYDKFTVQLDSVTIISDKNLIAFLEVVQILSGINYWYNGWIGYGITQHILKSISHWYIHHRHLISHDSLIQAYELVFNKSIKPCTSPESDSEWDEYQKKCDKLRIK